jgi:ATP-binding cassette subfamily F protein uup
MALLSVSDLHMSFGGPKLLDGVSFQIEPGQRVCIVGRNGEGKSTLLRLLSGDLVPDAGAVVRAQSVRVARLSQKVPEALAGTIFEVAVAGLGEAGRAMLAHHDACAAGDADLAAEIGADLERLGAWEGLGTVEAALSRLGLDPEARFETLSGGLKRRALLARALSGAPDVLLLDEPTNHLDIDSIAWLEEFLLRQVKTLVFITHDRMFLRRVATRIIELDRGNLADWSCDYDTFLKRKEDQLAAEEKQRAEFDKKLAREEVWIRQGIQARRTRNEGRVRALKQLRAERGQRRERLGGAKITMQSAAPSGKLVCEAEVVSFAWVEEGVGTGAKPVFADFSTTILRGDRVGLIGPNGSGKTTLLKVLLGRLAPTAGRVRLGTNLEVAYFDQHREELNPEDTVRRAVAGGNDTVTVDGRDRHVMGYLKDFLFDADRANSRVRLLSGGERNRLLLARLFTRPSNLLVMDEPTNDLDAETLELLEDRLMEYPGTVLIVSHDRAFLNNVVTSTLAFEGGEVREYVGGYDDWLRQRPEPAEPQAMPQAGRQARACPGAVDASRDAPKGTQKDASKDAAKPRKLTFGEQRELRELEAEREGLPLRIEALEAELEELNGKMSDPALHTGPREAVAGLAARIGDAEGELEAAFARWEAAEARYAELSERAG